ncbi:MAG TPA: efflux RND transporter periplasmic adaptor subunit [Firmicutes bacterium]|nr:efflux RND transporter periplasmic adaptor subunit [Bacillota bacterium]
MKKFLAIVLISAIVLVIILIGIKIAGKQSTAQKGDVEGEYLVPVISVEITERDIFQKTEYIGEIEPDKIINVFPKAPGKIIKNYCSEGDLVKKGKILSTIDRDVTGFQYKNLEVDSPATGFIVRVYADEGNSVSPQQPIFTLYEMDNVNITFLIPESDFVPGIRDKDLIVEVPTAELKRTDLKVSKIFPVLDPVTRSFKVQINVNNPEYNIKPGAYAKITVIFDKRLQVIAVHKDSIFEFKDKKFVYLIEDSAVRRQEIKTGIRDNLFLEVTEGLKAGDKIVFKGVYSVKDGDPVKIISEEKLEQ